MLPGTSSPFDIQVIERANASPYGLAAGVFAKDVDVINTLTRSLKCSTVWVNTYNTMDVAMPFGGARTAQEMCLHVCCDCLHPCVA